MADKELARVRCALVDKITTPVLKYLLDDLLEDEVLNDGEKESILEENSARTDRVRSLIDMVKKKGDNASRKMIAHLKIRDPELHSSLGLSAGEAQAPAADGPFPVESLTMAPFLIPGLNTSNTQTDNDIYPVKSTRSRLALLITNKDFTDATKNRNGAEKDEQNMEKLLTDLGYTVVKHRNLSGQEIDAAVRNFSQHPGLQETDSVFVIIMSHGKMGAILGVHWREDRPDEFPIDNIYRHLSTQNCPALLNKPKVIIIQACRGEREGAVMVSDGLGGNDDMTPDAWSQPGPFPSADIDDMEEDALRMAHKEKDFISLLSSTPDTVSYRQPKHGSFLVQYIVEVFRARCQQDHIEELFRKVMNRFEDFPSPTKRQMPTKDRCTLTKLFYLFPRH
ncbi:caspase a [Centroberyx gerrardi]|uniref:caspase a n=1 Tax=Centroberyx gerrardi TaxID=166262 RepID=UPI003AADAEC4